MNKLKNKKKNPKKNPICTGVPGKVIVMRHSHACFVEETREQSLSNLFIKIVINSQRLLN